LAQIPVSSTDSVGKPKRPTILTIVILLLFARVLFFIVLLVFAVYALVSGQGLEISLGLSEVLIIVLLFFLAMFLLVAAIGLWQLRPKAWAVNMLIMGFLLIVGLWIHFSDQAGLVNDLGLLLNVLLVLYLAQPDVRALFIPQSADS
jgi:hypothetical protein